MSLFGNSSRPQRPDLNSTGAGENGARPARTGDTTFLGEASQVPPRPAETTPPPVATFATESRAAAAAASQGPTPPERCTNVIASGAKWKGTLTVDDSVRVDGNFSGEIQSKATVHIAEGAQVDAKIRAAFVVVAGNFRGEMRCDQRVDLLPRSRVNGEVITKVLSVHEGAILDGRVQMTGGAESDAAPRLPSTRAAARAASLVEADSAPEERRDPATITAPASTSSEP